VLLIFFGAFTVALSGAMAPGPFLTMVIARSLVKGPWTGPLTVLGHMILELGLLTALVFGVAAFLSKPVFVIVVFLAGGVLLVLMGLDLVIKARGMSLKQDPAKANRVSAMNPVLAGILVSLSNPFWLIWWLTIGLGYVLKAMDFGIAGLAAFFSGHILADLAWYSLVSFSVAAGKKFVTDRIYRTIIAVCGLVLLGFGGWFLFGGIAKWLSH